jgi:hypothetical protein
MDPSAKINTMDVGMAESLVLDGGGGERLIEKELEKKPYHANFLQNVFRDAFLTRMQPEIGVQRQRFEQCSSVSSFLFC